MRISKTTLILLSLLSLHNLHAKKYLTGNKPSVLDLGILLARIKSDGQSSEEKKLLEKNSVGPITKDLLNFIVDEEAVIASAPIMRNFLRLSGTKKNHKKYKRKKFANAKKKLFEKNSKWFIFLTKDYEFVLLIPQEKYPEINSQNDLETIGFEPEKLFTIAHPYNLSKELRDLSSKTFDKLQKQKCRNNVPINSLLNLFTKSKTNKNKRILLSGHGGKQNWISNLTIKQYRKLRDTLNDFECSFLYVLTCYGAINVFEAQTEVYDGMSTGKLSKKNFIEIAQGLPHKTVHSSYKKEKFSRFFENINNFFRKEKEKLNAAIKERGYENWEYTEQNLITGEKIEVKRTTRVPWETKDFKHLSGRSKVKYDSDFKKIFEEFLYDGSSKDEIPSCRFPEDKEMRPLLSLVNDKRRREEIKKDFESKQKRIRLVRLSKRKREKALEKEEKSKQETKLAIEKAMKKITEAQRKNYPYNITYKALSYAKKAVQLTEKIRRRSPELSNKLDNLKKWIKYAIYTLIKKAKKSKSIYEIDKVMGLIENKKKYQNDYKELKKRRGKLRVKKLERKKVTIQVYSEN